MIPTNEEIAVISANALKNRLFASMNEQNHSRDNVIEYTFEYEVKDGYIFAIAYLINTNEIFNHIYRMAVISIYGIEEIFNDGNVVCGKSYTIETVKEKCKGYFNHYAKKFNEIC
jgi:hypothetical protein